MSIARLAAPPDERAVAMVCALIGLHRITKLATGGRIYVLRDPRSVVYHAGAVQLSSFQGTGGTVQDALDNLAVCVDTAVQQLRKKFPHEWSNAEDNLWRELDALIDFDESARRAGVCYPVLGFVIEETPTELVLSLEDEVNPVRVLKSGIPVALHAGDWFDATVHEWPDRVQWVTIQKRLPGNTPE